MVCSAVKYKESKFPKGVFLSHNRAPGKSVSLRVRNPVFIPFSAWTNCGLGARPCLGVLESSLGPLYLGSNPCFLFLSCRLADSNSWTPETQVGEGPQLRLSWLEASVTTIEKNGIILIPTLQGCSKDSQRDASLLFDTCVVCHGQVLVGIVIIQTLGQTIGKGRNGNVKQGTQPLT